MIGKSWIVCEVPWKGYTRRIGSLEGTPENWHGLRKEFNVIVTFVNTVGEPTAYVTLTPKRKGKRKCNRS